MVKNTNAWDISTNLVFSNSLTPADTLFTKNLTQWWNLVWVTTTTNPLWSIGNNATMSVDFTRTSGWVNNTNSIAQSFSSTSWNANLANPELWEAYAVYMTSAWSYAWNQDIVTVAWTLAWSSTFVPRQLLLAGSRDQKLVSFKVTAANDNLLLKNLTLSGVNINTLSNIRITDSNMVVAWLASNVTSNSIYFTNPSLTPIIMDTSATYYIIADINSSTDQSWISLTVNVAWSNLVGSNSTIVPMTGTDVTSFSHDISQNTFRIASAVNSSKALWTSAMRFTVISSGLNKVTLNNITFANTLTGYTTGSGQIKIYRNDLLTLVWASPLSNVTWTVSLTANNVVDAGTMANFIVIVDNTFPSGPTQDWSISMNSMNINTWVMVLDAASYPNNVESLPLTSVK
jgi:hypothetical protein